MGRHVVGRDAKPLVEHQAEEVLRGRIALLGAAPVPVGRERVVLGHAAAFLLRDPEVALCARAAALGGGRDAPDGTGIVTGPIGAIEWRSLGRRDCREGKRYADNPRKLHANSMPARPDS